MNKITKWRWARLRPARLQLSNEQEILREPVDTLVSPVPLNTKLADSLVEKQQTKVKVLKTKPFAKQAQADVHLHHQVQQEKQCTAWELIELISQVSPAQAFPLSQLLNQLLIGRCCQPRQIQQQLKSKNQNWLQADARLQKIRVEDQKSQSDMLQSIKEKESHDFSALKDLDASWYQTIGHRLANWPTPLLLILLIHLPRDFSVQLILVLDAQEQRLLLAQFKSCLYPVSDTVSAWLVNHFAQALQPKAIV